jgi:predicted RNA binding protein YcfA (HicA-like mRNA interferase family)
MTKLPVVSSDDVIRALKKTGFLYAPRRGKGSHVALHRLDDQGRHQLVIVPK